MVLEHVKQFIDHLNFLNLWKIDIFIYSIWPVTSTGKCCIGRYNTRSQRFSKK